MSSGGGGSGGGQESAEARQLYRIQGDIARDQWDEHKRIGSPVLAGLGEDALRGSESRREQMVGQASADVTQAFAGERDAMNRELTGMGVNPTSGRYVGAQRSMGLAEAGAKAGAMTRASRAAEGEDYSRKLNLVGITTGQGAQAQQGISSAANGLQGIADTKAQRKSNHQAGVGSAVGSLAMAGAVAF